MSFQLTNRSCILVTGGAGYIGSHTVLELLLLKVKVVVVDNLSNSSKESLYRVCDLTGQTLEFYQVDVCDSLAMEAVFRCHKFDAVIHFAGLKAVGHSVQVPLEYYQTNINATLALLDIMEKFDVNRMIFSSSATVYGIPEKLPLDEKCRTGSTNPYGRTKLFNEHIIRDACTANPQLSAILLRYFNPVGAHSSGRIGEMPTGIPNNLMPYVAQVSVSKFPHVKVFGTDYPTPDGTGIRDYIHVTDLARGHVSALHRFSADPGVESTSGCWVYNLGTGRGYSVLEMIQAMSKAVGSPIPYVKTARRPGDVAEIVADPTLAHKELNWKAEFDLDRMCRDLWRWQSQNPNGYVSPKLKSRL